MVHILWHGRAIDSVDRAAAKLAESGAVLAHTTMKQRCCAPVPNDMHLCAQLAGQHSQRVAVRAGYHAPAELAQTACGGAVLPRQLNGVHSPPRAAARLHDHGPVTEGLLPACSGQRVAASPPGARLRA